MSSARPPALGFLSHASGAALCFVLFAAPLAYACTRPEQLHWLGMGLHAIGAVWVLALAVERRMPDIPRIAIGAAVLLIAYVWTRYVFVAPQPISVFTENHFSRIQARWPESLIMRTPLAITLLCSGLSLALLVASDLARRTFWRRAFPFTMVACGVVVVFIGLLQNTTRASGIYWETPVTSMPSRFFGPFYHFTSAGAFINLTWPIAASLALYSFRRYSVDGRPASRAVGWALVCVTILLGHAGHVSRFPQVLAGTAIVALLLVYRPWKTTRWTLQTSAMLATLALLVVVAGAWTVARSGRLREIGSRWDLLHVSGSGHPEIEPPAREYWPQLVRDDLVIPWQSHQFLGDRGASYEFALSVLPKHPILGYGPGGWMAAVSQSATNPVLGTFFHYLQFTHDDFLQAAVEWGLVGAGLLAVLVAGGIKTAVQRLRLDAKSPSGRPDTPALVLGALVGLIAVLVQALIDFPLQIPANALYACVLLALCWSCTPRHANRESRLITTST